MESHEVIIMGCNMVYKKYKYLSCAGVDTPHTHASMYVLLGETRIYVINNVTKWVL